MTSNGMQAMTDRERMYHGKYTGTLVKLNRAERRANDALRRADALQREIDQLRSENASQAAEMTLAVLPDDDDPAAVTDIELTRLKRLIGELRAEDEERHAALICKALDAVSRIHDQMLLATGRRKRTGRDMGPYRRQGERAA